MVTAKEIRWSQYRNHEGPGYVGRHRFKVPPRPTEEDRIVAVITATEGGHYESYNGYDGQICSFGLIQVTERAYYQVSKMLGEVARRNPDLLKHLYSELNRKGLTFKPNLRGRWRFFYRDSRDEVDVLEEQQQMFFLQSSGVRGTWTDASRQYAKEVAAAVCTIMEKKEAQDEQRRFVAKRVRQYAFGTSKNLLGSAPKTDLGRAFTAAYLSFAVNNPVRANKHLGIALNKSRNTKWGLSWFIDVMKELTFGPHISIYPHRWNAIRKPLEQLYGLDLPDMADDLKGWKKETGHTFGFDAAEVQRALIHFGSDLGPAGADGKWGRMSRAAMFSFEETYGVPEELRDGMPDPTSMQRLRDVLEVRGYEELGAG